MKQLYEEALADVKKLKEVAEDNAKKALIEAVSPRIKDLIENELMKSQRDDLLLDDELEGSPESMAGMAVDIAGDSPDIGSAISLPDESGKVTLDLDALSVEPSGDSSEYRMSMESKKTLGNLVDKINSAAVVKVESKLFQLSESVGKLGKSSPLLRRMPGFKKLVSGLTQEISSLYEGIEKSSLDSSEKEAYQEKLENLYRDINALTEQRNMRNRYKINEGDVTLKLTGMPDDINLDDVGVDLITGDEGGDEEGEEEGGDDLDLGGDEEEGGEEGEEEGGDDLDLGGDEEEGGEEGGDELDLGGDEEEGGEEEELDLGGDEEKTQKESRMLKNSNLVVEIDENMLRREIGRMRALRESRNSDNAVVEIDENMLRREIGRMRALRESKEGLLGKDAHKWGHGAGSVSDDFEDDDLGDPFLDIKLRESDMPEEGDMYEDDVEEMDELDEIDEMNADEGMHQASDKEQYGGSDRSDSSKRGRSPNMESTQVESIRRRIGRERRLQVEAKKKAQAAKKQQKETQTKSQKAQHEAQQAKKKGQQGQAKKKTAQARQAQGKAKQLGEAYAYFATQFNESVLRTRRLMGMLNEATSRRGSQNGASRLAEGARNLRTKLAETNLFNTKLLYSNKLLQNESLTRRQKAEVIERLDEAKTDREVKLVYETMVKSFGGSGRQLSEAADRKVIGSSSQATRPASTLMNEGVELDRWAKLAGIK